MRHASLLHDISEAGKLKLTGDMAQVFILQNPDLKSWIATAIMALMFDRLYGMHKEDLEFSFTVDILSIYTRISQANDHVKWETDKAH